ncbi:MAG: hypothetical protein A2293_11125 [Elusimicrobia bacterium RIFOXYB2_FULL_49_7]|nr:MAG: hypothetical protein A2293_11125 [Elusimicrobia bacterium RIFOXYB2_FULL_49_7]
MRFLIFFNYSTAFGGAERSLMDMLSALDRTRFQPLLVTFGQGALTEAADEAGVERTALSPLSLERFRRNALGFHLLTMPLILPALVLNLLRLRRLFRAHLGAVLHTNNPKSHLMGVAASLGLSLPVVLHMRDIFPAASFSRLCLGLLAGKSNLRVIAISRAVQEALPQGLREKSVLIYNGIRPPKRSADFLSFRTRFAVPAHTTLILSAGRLVPWKGFDRLMTAVAPLLKHRACYLMIVGSALYWDRRYEEDLKRMTEQLDISGQVLFPGEMTDIGDAMAAADIFVLPSQQEPFGRVLVEAMLCGVPAVAFNECGPSEILRNNEDGLLVSPHTETALYEAVNRLMDDPSLRRRLGEAGRETARIRFTPQEMADQLHRFYDSLPGGGNA